MRSVLNVLMAFFCKETFVYNAALIAPSAFLMTSVKSATKLLSSMDQIVNVTMDIIQKMMSVLNAKMVV